MARDVQAEIALVKAVISHPAGFDLDFGGGLIFIRTTDQETIEVEWEAMIGATVHKDHREFPVEQLDEAAAFFVATRHELRLGIDFETEDCLKAVRHESPR